ncbi:MAG: Ig-like domain-containing protein [Actinomycetota bacterium]|nr:Ig-like domain-containing protein [Actinomycetota bacterium]
MPTGQVSFRDGTRLLGLSDLDAAGTARLTTTLDWGSHAISAIYRGDDTFGPSLGTLNHVVPGVASGADDDCGPPVREVDPSRELRP